MEGEEGKPKAKKKVVGSGVVVLAHARYEGQGMMIKLKWEEKTILLLSFKNIRSLLSWTHSHFPAQYLFVPPIRDAICGSPFLFPRILLPETAARKITPSETLRDRERPTPTSGGTRGVTRRAVVVRNATVLIKGEKKKWFLSSEPEERKLGRGLALSKRKAFPTSLVVLLLDHVACEVGVPEGDALPDLDLPREGGECEGTDGVSFWWASGVGRCQGPEDETDLRLGLRLDLLVLHESSVGGLEVGDVDRVAENLHLGVGPAHGGNGDDQVRGLVPTDDGGPRRELCGGRRMNEGEVRIGIIALDRGGGRAGGEGPDRPSRRRADVESASSRGFHSP